LKEKRRGNGIGEGRGEDRRKEADTGTEGGIMGVNFA